MSDVIDQATGNGKMERRRSGAPIDLGLPLVFDPEPQVLDAWETPDRESVDRALQKWNLVLEPSDLGTFRSISDGQEIKAYQPWQPLFRFGAKANALFLVESGTYIRVLGRSAKEGPPTLFPLFQTIQGGAILGPSALGDELGHSTVEACVCVKPGKVIQIKNPTAILRIEAVSLAMARSRSRDEKWLQEKMFVLQRSEDRVKSLIRSLARWKDLDDTDGKITFVHSMSQNALSDCLGMSDNTLRPYLKNDSFEWLGGKLWMTRDFVGSTGRQINEF